MFGEVPCRSPKSTHSFLVFSFTSPVRKDSSNSSSFCFIPASSHWTAKCPAAEPSVRIDAASPQNVWRRCGLAAVRARATTASSCRPLHARSPHRFRTRRQNLERLRSAQTRGAHLASHLGPATNHPVLSVPIERCQISNIIPASLDGGVGF